MQTDICGADDEAERRDDLPTQPVERVVRSRDGDPLDRDPLFEGAGVYRVGTAALRDDPDRTFEEPFRR